MDGQDMAEKRCGRCSRMLPLTAFHRNRRARDGYGWACSACDNARARAYRAAHPDAVKVAFGRWEQENREHRRAYKRERYWANPEAARAAARAAYHRYAEAARARVSMWGIAHRVRTRVYTRNRRVLLRRSGGSIAESDVLLLLEVQRGRCLYCLARLGDAYHIEHLTAVSRQGSGHLHNVGLACARCNDRKGRRSAGQFLALLIKEKRALH